MARSTRILLILAVALFLAPAAAHAAAPANDNFSAAQPLTVGTDIQSDTVDATAQPSETLPIGGAVLEPDCDTNVASRCTSSVWYTFTPSSSGTYTIETCDLGTDLDTVLAVYTGTSVDALTEVVSNDDNCPGGDVGNGSQVEFPATGGTTYHVEVAGFDAGQAAFYLRAYAGPEHTVFATPDTGIGHEDSFLGRKVHGGPSSGGPRHSASFSFRADQAGASFECSLDGAPFTACVSPISMEGLAAGSHTLRVRSIVAGVPDATPAIAIFSVDGSPPDTAIVAAPPASTNNPSVAFSALASERASFGDFQCSLDGQFLQTNCSPMRTYDHICIGPHSFQTAAIDPANNVDPTPAVNSFTETGGSACTPPTLGTVSATAQSPTAESIAAVNNTHGSGGTITIDYGTTAAYGSSVINALPPRDTDINQTRSLVFLEPGTLYHYRITVTTPQGSATTGDLMFTTQAPGPDPLPTASLGTPVVVGNHAAAFPVTVNPGKAPALLGVAIDNGPITPRSPQIDAPDIALANTPTTAVVDVVDLDPGTYHVRAFAFQEVAMGAQAMGPDTIVQVPAASGPPPPLPPIKPFKLRRGFVHVLRIRHGSKTITLVISHLPPGTTVTVTVNATVRASRVTRLASGHAKANKLGVARVKIKLSRKARKVLRNKHTKSLTLKVRAKPPGQAASSVTLRAKLKR